MLYWWLIHIAVPIQNGPRGPPLLEISYTAEKITEITPEFNEKVISRNHIAL